MTADRDILFEHVDQLALVVFTSEISHWLAPLLHPKRRHVFAVIPATFTPGASVEIDLCRHGICFTPAGSSPIDLVEHYEKQGLEVVVVPYRPEKRQLLPVVTNNCVALTKQVIGIRSWAFTPHQLWRHLRREPSWQSSFTASPA